MRSPSAAAEVASGIQRSVGWLDNGDGSLSVAYAAPGDTNIDWSIDILDAANFLALGKFDTNTAATWIEGDSTTTDSSIFSTPPTSSPPGCSTRATTLRRPGWPAAWRPCPNRLAGRCLPPRSLLSVRSVTAVG